VAAIALAGYPAALDLRLHLLALALGAVGLALLACGLLLQSSALLGSGLVALGGEYSVLFAAEGSNLDAYTPLYAATFLLVAELAYWSIERRVEAWSEHELVLWRLGYLLVVCGGAAALAAFVLVLAAAGGAGGAGLEAAGVAAVIGALGLLGLLVRSSAADS
jgi:hypothetical protein